MRRILAAALFASFAAAALSAASFFVLELRGGARVFALDRPMLKDRTVVFHRHPDGTYTGVSAGEVVRITTAGSADRSWKIQPGELLVLGRDIEGRELQGVGGPPPAAPSRPASQAPDYDLPWGYGWGWGHPPRPHPTPPPSAVPTTIGPNGFPVLAAPGSPGSTPPPIGSNGFPVIAPPAAREPR